MNAPTTTSPADVLAWQRGLIASSNYEEIGRAWVIVLEASAGAAVPERRVTDAMGVRLEFFGYGQKGQPLLPRIAQSRDRRTLLLLDPIVKSDGTVGLPDVPDPTWEPPIPTEEQVTGEWNPKPAPMIPQELAERARGRLKGTNYLVFGPVTQVLIRPEGLPEGWIAYCGGGPDGKQMELLVDENTGESFFFGGQFKITRVG